MGLYIKSLILSVMLGISCKEYYEALLPRRTMRHSWVGKTAVFAFTLGFMVISVSPIPPYIFMPIRVIGVVWIVAQIYFNGKWFYHLMLSVFFCGIIWIFSATVGSVLYLLPIKPEMIEYILDPIWCSILLFSMLAFSYRFKGKVQILNGEKRIYFGLFSVIYPVFNIIILMIVVGWDGEIVSHDIRLLFIMGFSIVSIFIFYFICNILIKDTIIQNMQIENELVHNQINMYRNMEQNYRRQQKYMHDYKNQLNCIQGLLEKKQTKEALGYIGELMGGIQKSTDFVDTNHVIVNVILNQKYQYAQENGITMVISVNDLSCLTMKKEDLVILLSNLLDNAIEACKKLTANKVIQFKMVVEEDNLILSVKNPMSEPLKFKNATSSIPVGTQSPINIKGKWILSSKKDHQNHGIGLANIESIVKKNQGVSSIKCESGYFSFSAMIPK